MLSLHLMSLGPLQTNCYLAGCEETRAAAIIDPAWDGRVIARFAEERDWQITHILLTHAHFDHVGGLGELKEATGAPIYAHAGAVEMLARAGVAAAVWGFQMEEPPPPEKLLAEGELLEVGRLRLQVLYTPGHAPGHVCFYLPDEGVLFDGDVLFQQGIGRTDLPGGDYALLMRSIEEKILTLPDETQVFPGHGEPTTVGAERELNPFLAGFAS
jgi:glyoxylase-like metal-dependent hydrolase (beta-lactamase superfamily II)